MIRMQPFKNTIIVYIFTLTILLHNQITLTAPKMFSGSIESINNKNLDFCVFYKGQKLIIERNSSAPMVEFSFTDDVYTIFLIIAQEITCCTMHANTLHGLQIEAGKTYLCYKLEAKRDTLQQEEEILTWSVQHHTLENNQIPNNSVIFLFSPDLVAGLKVQSWKPENMFRIIPTIMIDPNATEQELNRAINIAQLASLDIAPLHSATKPAPSTSAILNTLQQQRS